MVYKYREVRGTFTALTPDTTDADERPNLVPLNGSAVLTPVFANGGIGFTELGHFDQPQVKSAAIENGELKAVVVDGETGHLTKQALFLPVTVDDRADQAWSYEVSFPEVVRQDTGDPIVLPAKRFVVEDGEGPLNIVAALSSQKSGAIVTRGAPGPGLEEIVADSGQVVFVWDNGREVSLDMPEAVPGDSGPSAYEVAVAEGFEGGVDEWLDSLRGDGVGVPQTLSGTGGTITLSDGGGSVTIPDATASAAGLLGRADKVRLDGAFQQRVVPPTLNLNDLGDPGQYLFNSGSHATGANNFPEGAWGNQASVVVYTVGNSGGWKVQEVTTIPTLASKSRKFYRQHRDGWGEWFELATTGEAHNTPGMFGARGDGLRDDTAGMQSWLDSIAGRGYGTLPPGEYRITAPLTVTTDVRISGAGGVIFIDGGFAAIEAAAGDFDVELDGVRFRGTLGEGATPTMVAQRGLQLNNSGRVRLNNCRFENIHAECVRIHNAESWAVTDSTFVNYGYAGISVYTHGIGGTARGNHFYGTGVLPSFAVNSYAIATTHLDDTYRPARIVIQGNVVRNQAWEALDTHGGTETIFDSNIIQDCEAGIVATPRTEVADSSPSNIIISNNVVDAGGFPDPRQGISVAGSSAAGTTAKASGLIVGNTVRGYGRRGGSADYHTGAMHVTRGEHVTITGNQIIAPYGVACRFRQADDCVFSGNTVVGIVAEDGVAVPRRFAQVEGAVSLTMQNNTVIGSDGYVPLYQNTGQATGAVAAHGDGNSWDDRPSIAVA